MVRRTVWAGRIGHIVGTLLRMNANSVVVALRKGYSFVGRNSESCAVAGPHLLDCLSGNNGNTTEV